MKQKRVLGKLVQALNDAGIKYQITGGLAAITYGAKRPLQDIDIDVHREDMPRIPELFSKYITNHLHRFQDDNFDLDLINLNIDGVPVDISQTEDSYVFSKDVGKTKMEPDLSRAVSVNYEGLNLLVQDKAELIRYKTLAGRDVDLIDIEQMR